MNGLKLLNKYGIESQLYVALMGTFLAAFFMLEQNLFRFPTIILIFITYFSGYLYTKYQGNKKLLFKVLLFNFICGLVSIYLIIYNHNIERLYRWAIIVFLGLLYDSIFLKYYIRKIPLFKVFYVGFTWALINSWLILPEINGPVFFINWLFITALVLPFDIRDMRTDDVITFPQIIGVQNTKYLAYLMVFVATVISVFYLEFLYSFAFFITLIFTYILIYFSETTNRRTYFSFWIESCAGLPFLILILLKYF